MPRATGRASQAALDRIHRHVANSIEATFKQAKKDKVNVPANFVAQAIKFLQSTDSTAPARGKTKTDRLAGTLAKMKDLDEDYSGPTDADDGDAIMDFSTPREDRLAGTLAQLAKMKDLGEGDQGD